MDVIGLQGLASVLLVLALVGALAWLARRGTFAALRRQGRPVAIETAVPLGERRSLVIVNVEGRRLLLGLTPASVSMVTELAPGAFDQALEANR
ncbi:MAG: flagellar biosynthetic protein FliO [Vicinamibacterales bacterium]